MEKTRVLFVSQEINPFLPESEIASTLRQLIQGIHDSGKEIRVFMPRYGCINERRHQLHEVIRLSGMNLIIDDTDHPLIIKVASIPQIRIQVYFIDNEEYFQRKSVLADNDGNYFEDNDERSIFFARGVLETVKKLGWAPDVIHCHGWMTSMLPLYVRKFYEDDPHFADSKIIFSPYANGFANTLDPKLQQKLRFDEFVDEDTVHLENPTLANVHKMAIQFSDAVAFGSESIDKETEDHIRECGKPTLEYKPEDERVEAFSEFYDQVNEMESALAE